MAESREKTERPAPPAVKWALAAAILLGIGHADAGWMDAAGEALKKTQKVTDDAIEAGKEMGGKALEVGTEALEVSKEAGGKALDASKEAGGKALDASREVGEKAWDASREAGEKAVAATRETLAGEPQTPEERFADIWEKVLNHLDDGLAVFDRIKTAPESVFIGEDKQSLRADFNEILDDIILLLDDPGIREDRDRIESLRQKIEEIRAEIAGYREARITAPRKSMVQTTKGGYDKRIRLAKLDIADHEKEIDTIHRQLIDRFRAIGLDLNLSQVTTLLSRVDSENIIQMSVVFDVLKKITKQLMELTRNSGEEVRTAKRYYGMHVVLMEMVIHMQNKYVGKINSDFLPRIDAITEKTVSLLQKTERNIARESKPARRVIYQKNLQAQELTLRVARLYVDNLKKQRQKVLRAKERAMEDFRLANNTYETVEVSADLVNLLNNSGESFQTVMNLQVPEIIPFESLEMQQKYQELSRLIKKE